MSSRGSSKSLARRFEVLDGRFGDGIPIEEFLTRLVADWVAK